MRRDLGSGPARAVAWRLWEAAHALPPPSPQQPPPRPRIFVYDLPARWRLGPQLLAELDYGLLERLLLSPHREADPMHADYFWVPGPNLQPARKLALVKANWPYWNRTVQQARERGSAPARHILTLLGERAVGDTDLRPRAPAKLSARSGGRVGRPAGRSRGLGASVAAAAGSAAVDSAAVASGMGPEMSAEMSAASPSRAWLALTLNGMSDFDPTIAHNITRPLRRPIHHHWPPSATPSAQHGAPHSVGSEAGLPCHVCFQRGVDIVIPPPADSIDVPSCAELRALTAGVSAP